MKCCIEHDLFVKENEERAKDIHQMFLDDVYEQALEKALKASGLKTAIEAFKWTVTNNGLTLDEIGDAFERLFEDERIYL